MKRVTMFLGFFAACFISLSGCRTDADIASRNLSYEAEMFNIERRVVFFNGITNDYMLVIEGKCSIENDYRKSQLEVTCKTGDKAFKKHFLGLSDNVTYFVEQLRPAKVGTFHYKVSFRPQAIIPDVDFKTEK